MLVIVNSKDRDNNLGAPGNFKYTLRGVGKTDTRRFKVSKVVIPFSFYTVPRQALRWEESGAPYDLILPAGNYSASELASTLEQLLQAQSGTVYTIVYDAPSGHFTISTGGQSFRFFFSQTGTFGGAPYSGEFNDARNLGRILGFSGDAPAIGESASVTSDQFANLAVIDSLYIECGQLDNRTSSYFQKAKTSVIQKVPIDVDRGQFIVWQNSTAQWHDLRDDFVETMTFRLLDCFGEIVNLNGLNWSIELYME